MRFKMVSIAAAALLVLASPSLAREAPASDPAAEFKAMVEQVRAEMMRPGPPVKGWNVGGADPNAEIAAIGADKHYFLGEEGEERYVALVTDRRIGEFAPAAWRAVDSYGSPVAYAENPTIAFTPLGLRYVVAARAGQWRANGLDCSKSLTHAILYERTGVGEADLDAETAIGLFRLTMLAIEDQTVCSRFDGNARDGWRVRSLLPDGRDLPELNKDDGRMRIVPAAPIDTLIRGKKLLDPEPEAKR